MSKATKTITKITHIGLEEGFKFPVEATNFTVAIGTPVVFVQEIPTLLPDEDYTVVDGLLRLTPTLIKSLGWTWLLKRLLFVQYDEPEVAL